MKIALSLDRKSIVSDIRMRGVDHIIGVHGTLLLVGGKSSLSKTRISSLHVVKGTGRQVIITIDDIIAGRWWDLVVAIVLGLLLRDCGSRRRGSTGSQSRRCGGCSDRCRQN